MNVPDEPLRFLLRSSDASQQPNVFLCQALTMEEKEQWGVKINQLLDVQRNLLAALQNPRQFQDGLM
uniref:Uncharacterized protein n=1 Tax=Plectus sambesii TaxID=2011161 RepID=A0A914UQF5_9BILA